MICAAAVIAAAVAFGIGILLIRLITDWREIRSFAVISTSAYAAAAFGSWFFFIWPAVIAIMVVIAGSFMSSYLARSGCGVVTGGAAAAIGSGLAILTAAAVVILAFWLFVGISFDGDKPEISSLFIFSFLVGSVPTIIAAVAALLFSAARRRRRWSIPPT